MRIRLIAGRVVIAMLVLVGIALGGLLVWFLVSVAPWILSPESTELLETAD